MRKILVGFGVAVVAVAVLAAVGYRHRVDLVVFLGPRLAEITDPIAPNRPIEWQQGAPAIATPPGERPPNIVVILADDLGFNDISFYNGGAADGTLQTPHIDSIAAGGVAFLNGYAAHAVCAPSRAAIMTGRYSTRFGFEFTPFFRIGITLFEWVEQLAEPALPTTFNMDHVHELPEMADMGMPPSEVTVAEMLKAVGYQTLHIGKWHLGGVAGMRAEDQGFDESLHMSSGLYLPEDSPDVVNAKVPENGIDRMVWASMRYAASFNGSEDFEPDGYLTDYYTDEAVKAIAANENRPFFLFLAHWGIHNPLQATRADYDELAHIEDHRLRVYGAMIRALDRGVGRILDALDEHGLADNTLVVFTSDNGGAGYIDLPNVNHPYRGWKLTLFEGGVHVPFMARWPARIPAGTRYDAPVSHMDIFTTAAVAAGAEVPADRIVDGKDLLPFITGERTDVPHETLFWRGGHHQVVLHQGEKLIVSDYQGTPKNPHETPKRWLFNLQEDPTEQRNLAAEQPARVAELEALLAAHNAEQAEPMWPSVIDAPQLIDKTSNADFEAGDEYVYWPN